MSQKVVKLKIRIPEDLQVKITDWVKAEGDLTTPENPGYKPFWIGQGYTICTQGEALEGLTEAQAQRYFYLKRASYDFSWEWMEKPYAAEVRDIISQLGPLVKRITRIAIILQIPGESVPAHRDLFIGNTYNNLKSSNETYWGSDRLTYMGDPCFEEKFGKTLAQKNHENQNYFGLRIPLTEKPGMGGKPFVQTPGDEKHYYDMGNHVFLLDEASCEHGADPVDFVRGVIIVDGELDLNHLGDLVCD